MPWGQSDPNCGIARQKVKRERENYPGKSPNLRHFLAHSQNKGLSTRELAGCALAGDREACGGSQSQKGAISAPEGHPLQNCKQAPICLPRLLGILGGWHPPRESQQGSAPQKRHMAYLRRAHLLPPRKPSGWVGGGDKTHHTWGWLCSPSTWSPELLGPRKGTRGRSNRVWAFVEYLRSNLNQSGLDLGSARIPGPTSDSSRQSNLEPEQCRLGKHTHRERAKPSAAGTLWAYASDICLQCSNLPTARLNQLA